MIWNLDTSWLMMAIAVVSMLSFLLGLAVDGVMSEDGFGSIGNTMIIIAGFFLAIFVANIYGYHLKDMKLAVAIGLGGAFVALSTLAFAKAVLARL